MPTAFTAPVSPLPNELVLSSVLTFIAAAQLHAKVEKSIANAGLGAAAYRKVRVVVLADRGFGDVALYSELKNDLGFDFVIRFRKNVYVEHGGMLQLRHARLTGRFKEVESFVAVHDRLMDEPWFLATSLSGSGKAIARLYGKRFTIEETFRDQKDRRFGWGSTTSRSHNRNGGTDCSSLRR